MTARRSLTLALLLAATAWTTSGARDPRATGTAFRAAHPTIEPTLPLGVEMRLEEVERGPSESRASLVVVVTADRAIHDLEIALVAPPEGARVDTLELPLRPLDLAPGESKSFSLPVRGPGRRNLALRLIATFRTEDGRSLRVGQGVTLKADPEPQGERHAGAWEVMAVPLEALRP